MNQRYILSTFILYLTTLVISSACNRETHVVTGWNYNGGNKKACYAYGGGSGLGTTTTPNSSGSNGSPVVNPVGQNTYNSGTTSNTNLFFTSRRNEAPAGGYSDIYVVQKEAQEAYQSGDIAKAEELRQRLLTLKPGETFDFVEVTDEKNIDRRNDGKDADKDGTGDVLDGVYVQEHIPNREEAYADSIRNVALAWQAVVYKSVPDVATEYERYSSFAENEWMNTEKEVKSTFSIDVDNASYTNFRRFINQGQLPPKDAVRLEEWMNFFNYDLEAPDMNDVDPLKITSESGPCPWEPQDELVMIKLQGKRADVATLPASNLVFLVDVSGSMNQPNKLPLVQESMLKLVDQLRPEDKLSIVAYAGYAGIVLKPTSGDRKDEMRKAINGLTSGGGTAGSEGIKTAYKLAEENLVAGGNNRVIIASDGDWNIGITGNDELKKLIEEHRESGIYLSVMGFGMGNLNDSMMEMLADNGNGNYVYVDSEKEADRVFGAEFAGTMYTIAKDVKLQIEFDPTVVESYRLIGYENRVLENWMFEADSIDAGDLGMGQNVVAFYQIKRKETAQGLSVGKVDFRYKPLDSDESKLLSHSLRSSDEKVSSDYLFASCVAEFTMCLRESENRGNGTMQAAILRGRQNLGDPENKLGYEKRVEFVGMMESVGGMYEEYVLEEPEIVPEDKGINLKMYPNPTSDFTTIDVGEYLSGAWSVQVFDMAGALQSVQHFTDTQLGRVEVAGLPPATYIVKVYGQGYNFGYLRLVVI